MTEPPDTLSDPRELLLAYLDYYRDTLLRKLDGLSDDELRTSRLPSGWTPLELLKHLAFVERRWMRWGFRGEHVDPIWGETDPETGKWSVGADESAESVRALFLGECAASREIASGARLEDLARGSERFDTPERPPALSWILFHLLQEYARHVGQLDVVRELADGATGE
ncbi:DinB family protein [Amycolatopsis orientalis]|uniref:DinB family protein n=1 Tax=Amycolatopsis orientalis TaxID=31958 RepID=UPI0003A3D420|nr:DinB family protein [Amycolatopsis orientalis]